MLCSCNEKLQKSSTDDHSSQTEDEYPSVKMCNIGTGNTWDKRGDGLEFEVPLQFKRTYYSHKYGCNWHPQDLIFKLQSNHTHFCGNHSSFVRDSTSLMLGEVSHHYEQTHDSLLKNEGFINVMIKRGCYSILWQNGLDLSFQQY